MKLNFGCGKRIMSGMDWINVDLQKGEEIEKSFNFDEFPYPFDDNVFDYVLADNVMEHLIDPGAVVEELWRICKPGATVVIRVPYWNSKSAYNDIGHLHYFNERAIENLLEKTHSSYVLRPTRRFKIKDIRFVRSNMCRWIPVPIARAMGVYLCNIIRALEVTCITIK